MKKNIILHSFLLVFYAAGTADAAAKICYLGSETGDADPSGWTVKP